MDYDGKIAKLEGEKGGGGLCVWGVGGGESEKNSTKDSQNYTVNYRSSKKKLTPTSPSLPSPTGELKKIPAAALATNNMMSYHGDPAFQEPQWQNYGKKTFGKFENFGDFEELDPKYKPRLK